MPISIDEIINAIRGIMKEYSTSTEKVDKIRKYLDNIEASQEESNIDERFDIGSLQL